MRRLNRDPSIKPDGQALCLTCGLCCNGVIFGSGQFQPQDDMERLRKAGLKLKRGSTNKFVQPCGALDGCRCIIYPERPVYCRQFECALLRAVHAGAVPVEEAEKLVRKARNRAAAVIRLLRRLGEDNEDAPLALRFRRASASVQRADVSREEAALFGDLTVAVHRLNSLLNKEFYPHEG